MGGAGPPVILLHGILVSSWAWRFNLDALSRDFRVIAVCQKGHGWSGRNGEDYSIGALAAFVRGVADRLDLGRVDLVGNSLGGAVSLKLALDSPERVRRLVLVDPAAVPLRFVHPVLSLQSSHLSPLYRAILRPMLFQVLLRTLAYRKLKIDRHYMEWFMTPLRRKGTIAAASRVTRQLQPGLREIFARLGEIEHPVQLIWGKHDRLVPLKAGLILNRVLQTSRLEVFGECGHCAHEEDPDRFNQVVADFLSER